MCDGVCGYEVMGMGVFQLWDGGNGGNGVMRERRTATTEKENIGVESKTTTMMKLQNVSKIWNGMDATTQLYINTPTLPSCLLASVT